MIRRAVVLAITAVVVLGVAPPSRAARPESAGAPAGQSKAQPQRVVGRESLPADADARQRAQEPLLALNNRVYEVAGRAYEKQFAGARIDIAANTLTVFWAGAVPAPLTGLRAATAETGPTLDLRAARFSRTQLMAAADRVLPNGEIAGSVALAVDGSGLTVATTDLPAVARGARSATAAESRLLDRVAATTVDTGIPITLKAAAADTARFDDTRGADRSPYWAGARFWTPTSGCTSGFGMFANGSLATRFTLIAAHCAGYADGLAATNGVGAAMGVSDFVSELYYSSPGYDLGVVRLNAGQSNAPFIYIGEDSLSGGIPVAGYAAAGIPANGNYCVHGMRAVHCNLLSGGEHRKCTGSAPNYHCVYTVEMDTLQNGQLLWCDGDSSGPIYYWTGGSVMAAGLVSWSYGLDECSYNGGGASVVATAVSLIPGLRVTTTSAP